MDCGAERAPIPCGRAETSPPRRACIAGVLVSLVGWSSAARSARRRRRRAPRPRAARRRRRSAGRRSSWASTRSAPGSTRICCPICPPVNAAISALVLPSAFRPVPDPSTPTGSRWEMDPTLLVSAEVTSENPFTVTYKIRPEAQWTDNAPIAADDFWYLWRQMVSQPGVVDPAGYDLITGVQSIDGGKQAVVTFAAALPGVARVVQQHPSGAHRQGRAGRLPGRAGAGAAGHRRAVPGGDHRPAARRDPARPQRPVLGTAGQAGPDPVPPGRGARRAGRLGPQRRHPGGPSARRLSGFRAAVGHPRRADRPDHDAAGHAADAARQRGQAGRRAGAQGDPGTARRRPARRRRRGQRQHRHAWTRRRSARPATRATCRPRRRR